MASEVGICNLALQKLGASRITSLTEDSPHARNCNVAYEPMRDRELRAYPWGFALARTVLAPDATDPTFGPSYQFSLPTDFLRLHPDHDYQAETDWQIEGRKLLTSDGTAVYLRYIKRVEDPNEFDALFVDALACRIAFQLCEAITQSNSKKGAIWEEYRSAIAEAKRTSAIEKLAVDPPEDDWVTVRR